MILIYGKAGQNCVQAQQLYLQRYPHRYQLSRFGRLVNMFYQSGNVHVKKDHRKTKTDEDAEISVLAAVTVNPHFSCR